MGRRREGIEDRLRAVLPEGLVRGLRRQRQRARRLRRPARWGNVGRLEPFSAAYGVERGLPVDRIYIERFVASHRDAIHGTVLEVKDATYTRRFGGAAVRANDVLDLDADNPQATLIADLGAPGSLPEARYDAIICTQTLHLIPDPPAGMRNLYRALRPGGTLLLTVPLVGKVEFAYDHAADLWRFTPSGLRHTIEQALPGTAVEVSSWGNLRTTTAFLLGLAAEDIPSAAFEVDDPRFPLIVGAILTRT